MAWKWSLLGNSSYKGTLINAYQNFLWIHVIDMTSGKYMLATASPNGKVKLLFFARDVIKRWGPRISPSYYECGPWLLSKEYRRKTEPKETLSCMISHQLVVFTQQLEIVVTTLLCTLLWSLIYRGNVVSISRTIQTNLHMFELPASLYNIFHTWGVHLSTEEKFLNCKLQMYTYIH